VLDKLRGRLRGLLESAGRGASKVIPIPTAWTVIGFFFAVLASFYYAAGNQVAAGVMVMLSGLFDVLDGSVARATGKVSLRGAFLDSTLDRFSEVLIFLGLIWWGQLSPFVVGLALSFSLLVSYTRAKGDALGVDLAGVGVGERSERLVVLIVTSLLSIVGLGVFIIVVIAFITFVQRTIKVSNALARSQRPIEGEP
jgi:archaetidylinositol phosphate synthase